MKLLCILLSVSDGEILRGLTSWLWCSRGLAALVKQTKSSCKEEKANEKTPTLKHLKLHNWCKSHASKIHFCKQIFFCLFRQFQFSILWIFAQKLTQKLIEIGLLTKYILKKIAKNRKNVRIFFFNFF